MTSESKHIAIAVNDLSIGYFRRKKALAVAKPINFSIESGNLIALVGANGIGKSTLLRTVSGMPAIPASNVQHSLVWYLPKHRLPEILP